MHHRRETSDPPPVGSAAYHTSAENTLQRIAPKEEGDFYRVRTSQGEQGSTWKRNVSRYNRDEWMRQGRWADADDDCQDSRHEVLIAESITSVTLNPQGCRVIAGTWQDPYGGETFTNPSDIDIDHLVPPANAHISGGWGWDSDRKQAYANDLTNPEHLIAVRHILNQQKGDKGPDQWKPPRQAFWCDYATAWLAIKKRWQLMLTADARQPRL
jgi:Protein of unknown function (DUF1524)